MAVSHFIDVVLHIGLVLIGLKSVAAHALNLAVEDDSLIDWFGGERVLHTSHNLKAVIVKLPCLSNRRVAETVLEIVLQ